MSDPKLLPCPFCGGEAVSGSITMKFMGKDQPKTHGVMCDNESCLVKPYLLEGRETASEAIAAWNRRSSDWQPIETAPKDHSFILLCDASDGEIYFGRWANANWDIGFDVIPDFTHWMPLPTPPEVSE